MILITPYTGTGTDDDPQRPLFQDLFPGYGWMDATGNPMANGIPAVNLYVIEVPDAPGSLISSVKSDSRFFVLKPGPGNKGSALLNWLADQGVTDHGVTEDDDEDTATAKLKRHFEAAR